MDLRLVGLRLMSLYPFLPNSGGIYVCFNLTRRQSVMARIVLVNVSSCDMEGDMRTTEVKAERLAYSVRETAAILGLSVSNTYDLVSRGLLPSRTVRGRRLIPKRLLEQWLESGQVTASGAPDAG